MLTETTPVIVSSLLLEPGQKTYLVLDDMQNIYRVKNCCGKISAPYKTPVNFLIENLGPSDFYAIKGTTLSELFLNTQVALYARVKMSSNLSDTHNDIDDHHFNTVTNENFYTNDHDHDDVDENQCCWPMNHGDKGDGLWINAANNINFSLSSTHSQPTSDATITVPTTGLTDDGLTAYNQSVVSDAVAAAVAAAVADNALDNRIDQNSDSVASV